MLASTTENKNITLHKWMRIIHVNLFSSLHSRLLLFILLCRVKTESEKVQAKFSRKFTASDGRVGGPDIAALTNQLATQRVASSFESSVNGCWAIHSIRLA